MRRDLEWQNLDRRGTNRHFFRCCGTNVRNISSSPNRLPGRFKFYNDSLGHDVGDEILIEFGKRLCQKVRNGLVGRFGGDEFIVILPHIKNTERVEHAVLEIVSALTFLYRQA